MADFYGTAAGFAAYHEARGNDVAERFDDEDDINAALLVASEWIDNRRASFPGTKVGYRAQVREWPRTGGYDWHNYLIASDSVPAEVVNAAYEAALRQLIKPGCLTVDWTPTKYKSASVDGAVSVVYANFSSSIDMQTQFAVIDQILAPIMTGASDASTLSGSVSRV